jgi:G2/mitotic-specific cyclin 3/4
MLPNAHYMDNQPEIQWPMRSVLLEWLVEIHLYFCLSPETLFLSVNYIDRFLSRKIISLRSLQLVGATAIFLAAKYEYVNCLSVGDIVSMVDGSYTVDEILKAERFMLHILQFELGWPGPMSFLRRISKADNYDLDTRTLAKYFLEVTIMDERFVSTLPSFIAAGAHCFARMILKNSDWASSCPC